MNWIDFWDALGDNGVLPSAGAALMVVGATFRWFEEVCNALGRWGRRSAPFGATRDHVRAIRAAGDEESARRVEARLQDQRRRLNRYGHLMMIAGAVVIVLSTLLR